MILTVPKVACALGPFSSGNEGDSSCLASTHTGAVFSVGERPMGAVGGGWAGAVAGPLGCWHRGSVRGSFLSRGCEAGRSPLLTSPSHWPPWEQRQGAEAALHAGPRGAPRAGACPLRRLLSSGRSFSSKCPWQAGRCEGRGMMVSRRGLLLFQTCMHPRGWREGVSPSTASELGHGCQEPWVGPGARCVSVVGMLALGPLLGWESRAQIWLGLGGMTVPWRLAEGGVSGQHVGKSLCV